MFLGVRVSSIRLGSLLFFCPWTGPALLRSRWNCPISSTCVGNGGGCGIGLPLASEFPLPLLGSSWIVPKTSQKLHPLQLGAFHREGRGRFRRPQILKRPLKLKKAKKKPGRLPRMVQEQREGCGYFALIYGHPLRSVGVESLWGYFKTNPMVHDPLCVAASLAASARHHVRSRMHSSARSPNNR